MPSCNLNKRLNSLTEELNGNNIDIPISEAVVYATELLNRSHSAITLNNIPNLPDLGIKNISKDVLDNLIRNIDDSKPLTPIQTVLYNKLKAKYDVVSTTTTKGSTDNIYDKVYNPDIDEIDTYELELSTELTDTYLQLLDEDTEAGVYQHRTAEFNSHIKNTLDTLQSFWKAHEGTYSHNLHLANPTVADIARGTVGEANIKKNYDGTDVFDITVFHNPINKSSAVSEVFLHEVIHTFVKKALSLNPSLGVQLKRLRAEANKTLNYSIFLQSASMSAKAKGETKSFTEKEIEEAKHRFEYVFNENSDIEEFFAYSMSNSFVHNAVKDMKVERVKATKSKETNGILRMFEDITNALSNAISTSASSELHGNAVLMSTMNSIVNFHDGITNESSFRKTYYLDALPDFFNKPIDTLSKFLDLINDLKVKLNKKTIKMMGKLFSKYDKLINSKKVDKFKRYLDLISDLPIVSKMVKGVAIRNLFNQITMDTVDGKFSQFHTDFRKFNNIINKVVKDIKVEARNQIQDLKVMTPEYIEEAETYDKLLRNGSVEHLDNVTIDNEVTKESINARLGVLKGKLRNVLDDAQFAQLEGLSTLIDTRVSTVPLQQINTNNILNRFHDKSSKATDLEFNEAIETLEYMDELVSLTSLDNTFDDTSLKSLNKILNDDELKADLLENHKFLHNTFYNRHVNPYSRTQETIMEYSIIPQTYYKEDNLTGKYTITLYDEDALKYLNKYNITILNKDDPILINGVKHYKVKFTDISPTRDEGSLSVIGYGTDGISLSKYILNQLIKKQTRSSSKLNVNKKLTGILKSLEKNPKQFTTSKNFNIKYAIPKYNKSGELIDFILPLSNTDVISDMAVETGIQATLPYSVSRLNNISLSYTTNRRVIDSLINYETEYGTDDSIAVSQRTSDAIGLELWEMLSHDTKEYLKNVHSRDGFNVPRDIANLIIGSRTSSLVNLIPNVKGSKAVLSSFRTTVKFTEKIVGDMLGVVKNWLVLFNPDIVSGNIYSNMNMLSTEGISNVMYVKGMKEGWVQLNDYTRLNKKLVSLQLKKNKGLNVDQSIRALKKQLNEHSFNALLKDGQFTPLIDDLDTESTTYIGGKIDTLFKLTDSQITAEAKRLTKIDIDTYKKGNMEVPSYSTLFKRNKKKLKRKNKKKLPIAIDKARSVLYGLKGSSAYKLATKVVMYSDTIAKNILLEKLVADLKKEKQRDLTVAEHNRLLRRVSEIFINYSYPTSGIQMWMEKVFGLHFQKYFYAVGKGYKHIIKSKPVDVAEQQAIQALTFDTPDPIDTYIGKTDLVDKFANRWKLDDMGDVVSDLVTPNILDPFDFNLNSLFK